MIRFLVSISTLLFVFSCTPQKHFLKSALYNNMAPYLYYYDGIQNRLFGNNDEAIQSLIKSIEYDSTNDAAYYELALCYSVTNDLENSLQNLNKAVKINPNNKYYRELLSVLLITNNEISLALENQKELIKIDSISLTNRYQLALLYSELNLFDDAEYEFSRIENNLGFVAQIAETRLRILLKKKDYREALEHIEKLILFDSSNPMYLLYKSDILFLKGYDSLAFDALYKANEIDIIEPLVDIELYQRNFESGNAKIALKYLFNIINFRNIEPEEKVRLFFPILFEQTYYTNFIDQLDTIIFILRNDYPESIAIHEICFEHFIRKQDLKLARETLEILVFLDDFNPLRWEKLVSFDYSTNKKELVIKNSSKASKKFPQSSIFYIFQAIVLEELSNREDAILVLKYASKIINNNENLSEILGTLGDMYYKNLEFKKAFKSYKNSISHNPNNARILNNYSYYLALKKKDLNIALEMSTNAVNLEPNNSVYLDTKGWVLFKMGRFEESREVLRNAIAKGGNTNAVINEHYGDALYMTGNKDNAYNYWIKARDIGEGTEKLEEKIRTKTYIP